MKRIIAFIAALFASISVVSLQQPASRLRARLKSDILAPALAANIAPQVTTRKITTPKNQKYFLQEYNNYVPNKWDFWKAVDASASFAFKNDSKTFAVLKSNSIIDLWDLSDKNALEPFKSITLPNAANLWGEFASGKVAFSPDGQKLVALTQEYRQYNGNVTLTVCTDSSAYNENDFTITNSFSLGGYPPFGILYKGKIFFTPDGYFITHNASDQTIVLDSDNGQIVKTINTPHPPIAYNAASQKIATLSFGSPQVEVWSLESGQQTTQFVNAPQVRGFLDRAQLPAQLAFNSRGTLLAVTSRKNINLWDPQTGQKKMTIANNMPEVNKFYIDFSPDDNVIAFTAGEQAVLYDLANQNAFKEISIYESDPSIMPAPQIKPSDVKFSPDGSTLAVEFGHAILLFVHKDYLASCEKDPKKKKM
jgi:WD40 repeat protein